MQTQRLSQKKLRYRDSDTRLCVVDAHTKRRRGTYNVKRYKDADADAKTQPQSLGHRNADTDT